MTALDALFALFAPAVVLFVAGWVATLVIVSLWCVKEQHVASQPFYDQNGGTQPRILRSSFR